MAEKQRSLWTDALRRLKRDRLAMASLAIILFYVVLALGVQFHVFAQNYAQSSDNQAEIHKPPSALHWFGTDIAGRDILARTIYGAKIALTIGLIVGLISVTVGLILGAIAGYSPGWVDEFVVWLYTTIDAVPYILLLVAFAFVLKQAEVPPLVRMWLAMSFTFWTGTARVIRGEVIKQRTRDYVMAAKALGASEARILFVHIVPNVLHLGIVNFSILFVSAIKNEVILSYLGLGVVDEPSWGILIDNAKMELGGGYWWQLTAATGAMFFLVLAFNLFSDALRDALDPKLHR